MQIIFKNIYDTLLFSVENIFDKGDIADKHIPKILKSKQKWGSRDRALYAKIIYTIVRKHGFYSEILAQNNIEISNTNILDLAIYIDFSDFILPKEIAPKDFSDIKITINIDDFRFSIWLKQRFHEDYPTLQSQDFAALDKEANIYIRVNTLKVDILRFISETKELGIFKLIDIEKGIFEVPQKNNLTQSIFYKNGWFHFQDIGSQQIGNFCELAPNSSVIDLCAGAGGKTLQLSAILKNKGKIFATDINSERLDRLKYRAKEAGALNIFITPYNEIENIKADIVLIDAPCSGTGTFKRQADAKWKLTPEQINQYITIQAELLEKSKMLINDGGKIVFATCSILKDEGENQISNFLANNNDFSLQKSFRTNPFHENTDGFFMAMLVHK
jgi:16S rRNA (cytosine967-C5)-methyltransferase